MTRQVIRACTEVPSIGCATHLGSGMRGGCVVKARDFAGRPGGPSEAGPGNEATQTLPDRAVRTSRRGRCPAPSRPARAPAGSPAGLLTLPGPARIAIVLMKREKALRVTRGAAASHASTCGPEVRWGRSRISHASERRPRPDRAHLATVYKEVFRGTRLA